ncbi:hypothetical protein BV455_01984 [Parageobacillus caldoxylosilyticus]|nr:hypothetical protein BV455_01984 [Parageobacillus caldoxylosilyticus]
MISNLVTEHTMDYKIIPLLEALFRYIDQFSLPETLYMTRRLPIPRKYSINVYFLKHIFPLLHEKIGEITSSI